MHASHISSGSSVTRGQRLRFTLRHVFALSYSNTSSLPDYFVFTTSTFFSTISVLHVRSTSQCQSTSAPARWSESGRLTDSLSLHTRIIKNPRAQGNLLQIHKSSSHGERSPIDATFSVGSCKTNVLTWRLLWHRRWKLPYILGRMSWRIRKSTWIRNSRITRVSSILLKKIDTGTV